MERSKVLASHLGLSVHWNRFKSGMLLGIFGEWKTLVTKWPRLSCKRGHSTHIVQDPPAVVKQWWHVTFVRLPSTHSLTQTFLFSSFFYIYFGPHSIAISKYVHALAPKLLYHGLIRATTERSHSVFMKSTAIRSRINGHIFSGGFHYKVIFLLRNFWTEEYEQWTPFMFSTCWTVEFSFFQLVAV